VAASSAAQASAAASTFAMRLLRLLPFSFAAAIVDESGRYHAGNDLTLLSPPDISEEDKAASIDLSQQPVEKLFRLLAFELMREEKRPLERRLGIGEFQHAVEQGCEQRIMQVVEETQKISEEVQTYHLNITSTAGLFWLLHKYPEEHSWVWLLGISSQRVLRKVGHYFSRIGIFAVDDIPGCISPNFRTVLMNAAATWRKIHGDYIALLWNSVAFGVLGDVTSWREVDEETEMAEEGPGGPPPNVSWSENLIFGNMFVSSVAKWLEHHSGEVTQVAYAELTEASQRAPEKRWPSLSSASPWHRSKDGVISSFEYLRRQVFGGWSLDKGFLRGLIRHVWQPGFGDSPATSVADFGAGGGRYSEWLNETGLVKAFAFDAALSVAEMTGGKVQEVDLAVDVHLWRTFDWVLCLEVAERMPQSQAGALLRNVRRHAEQGLIISWSDSAGDGRVNPLPEADFVALVERETGFHMDKAASKVVRESCEQGHLAKTAAVFRVQPRS